MHVKLTLLLTNSMQTKQQIFDNANLKIISLPQLTETTPGGSFIVRDDPSPLLYTALFPLTHNLSLPPSLQVDGNPKLKKMCASKLENVGGQVCIGNNQNQPFLDADLSELVDGSFSSATICYQDSDASTVCGRDDGGLFSTDGCPSSACPTADE